MARDAHSDVPMLQTRAARGRVSPSRSRLEAQRASAYRRDAAGRVALHAGQLASAASQIGGDDLRRCVLSVQYGERAHVRSAEGPYHLMYLISLTVFT